MNHQPAPPPSCDVMPCPHDHCRWKGEWQVQVRLNADQNDIIQELEQERNEARRLVADWRVTVQDMMDQLHEAEAALTAERTARAELAGEHERLRGALARIRDARPAWFTKYERFWMCPCCKGWGDEEPDTITHEPWCEQETARAALAGPVGE